MTRRNAVLFLIAGLLALAATIFMREFGAWFPALEFLGWAGLLAIAGGVLVLASLSLEERR